MLFPYSFNAGLKGILLLAGRLKEIEMGKESDGYVSEQREKFLNGVGHEIKVEIENTLNIVGLKRVIEEKNDLLANAGHGLVAPLDLIYGKTEHLMTLVGRGEVDRIAENTTKIKTLCESLDKDVIRTALQTRSFLMFMRGGMESEEYKFDKAISLNGLLNQCAEDFKYLAMKRGINIYVDDEGDVPKAYFDREKLMIAFSNLVDNAVKYSNPVKNINILVSFDQNKNAYTISISDFGKGIPEQEREKIFEKYYRSKWEDPKRFIPGTGIGLTVTREIVTRHNGRIWVTSKQGESIRGKSSLVGGYNTTFWIRIPRRSKPT